MNNKLTIENEMIVPRNEELERAVLGEILVAGSNGYMEVENILSIKSFYSDVNATIFSTFGTLSLENKQISPLEVMQVLRAEGKLEYVGGAVNLAALARETSSTTALLQHANALKQYEIKRGAFMLAEKLKAMSADDASNEDEVLEFADKGITELQSNTTGHVYSMDESLTRYYEWSLDNECHKNAVMSSGLKGLDDILDGGFRAPDLIVVGGRPSMGKTQLAVHFAECFVRAGWDTLFFSLEMLDIQLIHRMVAKDGLNASHVRKGTMTAEERAIQEQNMTHLQGLRLHIASDECYKQLSAIKAEAYRYKRQGKVKVIIIDYLQHIRTKLRFEKRYLEVGYITSELKSLAKELGVPIILLAQLGRKNDADADQVPKMEDLRESGNIEQDADVIIFPHRPWVYNNEATDPTGRSWKDRGILYIAKNREGKRNVKTYFMTDPQFKEISDDEQANDMLPHE